MTRLDVCVAGLGYVGLPLAIRAAEAGHKVLGVDPDINKIRQLGRKSSYVEDVSDLDLTVAIDNGRFKAGEILLREDLFDIAIITVPTPLRDGVPDLSYVERAAKVIGGNLRAGNTVVLESTTYPGTTEGLLARTLERASGLRAGVDFHLGFSPERIDPGHKVYTLQNTPKLVSATTEAGLARVKAFYDTVVDTTVPVSSPRVAEMTKIFENTQANVLIALINEVSDICRDLGIDVHEMIEASMTKGHSMSRWTPGPGVGGHCLPIDPMYLAWQSRTQLGKPFRFAELADQINNSRPATTVARITEALNCDGKAVKGSKILVAGVAYKPNVGDTRESPALPIVRHLLDLGAMVEVADPHVIGWGVTPVVDTEDLMGQLPEFDLMVVVTDHDAFDLEKMARQAKLVLDCRNAISDMPDVVRL